MTRLPAFVLAAIVAVAVGGGLGAYFAVRGPSTPPIPPTKRSPVLEEAKAKGIISGYRVIPGPYGTWGYEVSGGEISLALPDACGERSCPAVLTPHIVIDYRHTAAAQARAILKITQRWVHRKAPAYRIIFGPPYYP